MKGCRMTLEEFRALTLAQREAHREEMLAKAAIFHASLAQGLSKENENA